MGGFALQLTILGPSRKLPLDSSLQLFLETFRIVTDLGKKHNLLFVEQNGNDNADDEHHGQDGPNDPDQPFLSVNDWLWVRVVQLDRVGERTSSKSLEDMKDCGTEFREGTGIENDGQTCSVIEQRTEIEGRN